jgi:hypothetical protein
MVLANALRAMERDDAITEPAARTGDEDRP